MSDGIAELQPRTVVSAREPLPLVQRFVRQVVGALVLRALDVANLELVELLDQGAGLLVQRDQVVGADVVLAADLADDEPGVALGDDLRVPLLEGALQAADQRGVLGLVVGGFADVLVTLDAVAVRENAIADTSRPRGCRATRRRTRRSWSYGYAISTA